MILIIMMIFLKINNKKFTTIKLRYFTFEDHIKEDETYEIISFYLSKIKISDVIIYNHNNKK